MARSGQDVRRWLQYWRAGLAESQLSAVDPSRSGASQRVSLAEVKAGKIPEKQAARLFHRARRPSSSKERESAGSSSQERESELSLPILLSPITLVRTSFGRGPKVLNPFLVPADLARNGDLTAPPYALPWIPRVLLAPAEQSQVVILGSVDDLEKALADSSFAREDRVWSPYWTACRRSFERVIGTAIEHFEPSGWRTEERGLLLPLQNVQGMAIHILRLYDRLISSSARPRLVATLVAGRAARDQGGSSENRLRARLNHLGEVPREFALEPSQRRVLLQTLSLDRDQILAVNGPPGTGKSTLLQSIAASFWVRAAFEGDAAPLVLVSSTNNRAILSALQKHSSTGHQWEDPKLGKRWLPDIGSYGLFCVSTYQAGLVDGEDVGQLFPNGGGFLTPLTVRGYRQRAAQHFLAQASEYFDRPQKDVGAVVRGLHRRLVQVVRALRAEIAGLPTLARHLPVPMLVLSFAAKLQGGRGSEGVGSDVSNSPQCEVLRRQAFLLAARYWEGRWLLEAERAEEVGGESIWPEKMAESPQKRWRQIAMLVPCFGVTLHMAPRFFGGTGARQGAPPTPYIDLLMIDEAGQVSTEIAAATVCLARRALVIGDVHQIEPVRELPERIDRVNLRAHGLAASEEEEEALLASGLAVSQRSLMEAAQRATRSAGDTGGLWLQEHYRCVPEIMAYCNELAYGDILKAKRPSREGRVLPALGYAQIAGRAQREKSSWHNSREARVIAGWLAQEGPRLVESYNDSGSAPRLSDLVGVVTPFTAQARLLKEELKNTEGQGESSKVDLSEITVGTVHTFQGDERPVILFSPVYDRSNRGLRFFDRGVNMLNVAVSRAQDSFLVFGEMALFDPGREDLPSGLLARHLFQSEDQEITALPLTALPELESVERVTTLERHRELLKLGLTNARQRVVVISPWLSQWALRADEIPARVQAATDRDVQVEVYTDKGFNEGHEKSYREARGLLERSGARVHVVKGVHAKTLCCDDVSLAEGSFNWLSAARSKKEWQRYEVSFVYRGPKVKPWIEETLKHLQGLTVDGEVPLLATPS